MLLSHSEEEERTNTALKWNYRNLCRAPHTGFWPKLWEGGTPTPLATSSNKGKKLDSFTPESYGTQYLNACMTAKVEVEFKWVGDVGIHSCSCRDVATLANLQRLITETQALHCLVALAAVLYTSPPPL